VARKGGWAVSQRQLDWLLSGCPEGQIPRTTLQEWMADPQFVLLAEKMKLASTKRGPNLREKALNVLEESLGSAEADERLKAVRLVNSMWPEDAIDEILVKPWKELSTKKLAKDKAKLIKEEIEELESKKKEQIPVPSVGLTQYGKEMGCGPNMTSEIDLEEHELDRDMPGDEWENE